MNDTWLFKIDFLPIKKERNNKNNSIRRDKKNFIAKKYQSEGNFAIGNDDYFLYLIRLSNF